MLNILTLIEIKRLVYYSVIIVFDLLIYPFFPQKSQSSLSYNPRDRPPVLERRNEGLNVNECLKDENKYCSTLFSFILPFQSDH